TGWGLTLPKTGHQACGAQNVEHASRKSDKQEDYETPWRGSGKVIHHPANADAHHHTGDELAGQLERLAVTSRTARLRVVFPLKRLRMPCCQRCPKLTPTALKFVVADVAFAVIPRAGLSGSV